MIKDFLKKYILGTSGAKKKSSAKCNNNLMQTQPNWLVFIQLLLFQILAVGICLGKKLSRNTQLYILSFRLPLKIWRSRIVLINDF